MNGQQDPLQELWKKENAGANNDPLPALPSARIRGQAEAERLRRSVANDGWLKLIAVIVIPAAWITFADRLSFPVWGVLGFLLLSIVLGAFQIAWSGKWRDESKAGPLAEALSGDLQIWRRRRPWLALLLGATPALAWQVYQLAYLAMNPGSVAHLANILFLVAGGPLLWLLTSWRQWARLEAWLLQIEQALGAFDEDAAENYARARRRANQRTVIIVVLLLLLLLTGAISFWLTQ